jgi:hypothetical protein
VHCRTSIKNAALVYQIHATIIGQLSNTTGRDKEKLFLVAQANSLLFSFQSFITGSSSPTSTGLAYCIP